MGEDVARCPSCSLFITVIYNHADFAPQAAAGVGGGGGAAVSVA